MKTNTKSFRPSHRFAVTLNDHPYGLVTAKTIKGAIKNFHILTGHRYFNIFGWDIDVKRID